MNITRVADAKFIVTTSVSTRVGGFMANVWRVDWDWGMAAADVPTLFMSAGLNMPQDTLVAANIVSKASIGVRGVLKVGAVL